jgi:hypothetical protein
MDFCCTGIQYNQTTYDANGLRFGDILFPEPVLFLAQDSSPRLTARAAAKHGPVQITLWRGEDQKVAQFTIPAAQFDRHYLRLKGRTLP